MIPLVRQSQQTQTANRNTLDLLAKTGTYIGNGVTTWSNFDEKTPVSALPDACKLELTKTFKNVGCKTYNPKTVELVFEKIQEGLTLVEIIHALHKRKGCGEANIRWIHAAIKKGYKNMYMQNAPSLPKKEGRVRLHFGINP